MHKPSFVANYLNKPALIMLFFGFSAGLPLMLIVSSLSLWLREAGIDRSMVTMFAWAALGYSFKFIWSPLVDSLPLPVIKSVFGQRKSWLLLSQCVIYVAIVAMAMTDPQGGTVAIMAIFAVILGFASATQDIVIDAYRIESAPTDKQPILSAMYVAGYRIGMIASGAGALYLADFFGSNMDAYSYTAWQKTYFIMACLSLVSITTTLVATEPCVHFDDKNHARLIKNDRLAKRILYAVVPLCFYGVYYLIVKLFKDVFGFDIAVNHLLKTVVFYYGSFLLILTPVFLFYFLKNQPKFTDTRIVANNKDNIRLFLVFIFCVIAFVFGFKTIGAFVSVFDTTAITPIQAFLLETFKLISSVFIGIIVAILLIYTKFIDKKIVMQAWVMPIQNFFDRYGKKAILLLALIGLYRISDIVAGNISNVFYQDLGFSKTDIANAVKFVGVIMAIFGGFLGGILSLRLKIMYAMLIGAILASATNLLFIALNNNPTTPMLYMAVIVDNLASGLASAIFVAFLSALTSIRFTAVQYALLSSLMTLIPKVLGGYAGSIVDNKGYDYFFEMTFLIGMPVLVLIFLVGKYIVLDTFQLDDNNNSKNTQ